MIFVFKTNVATKTQVRRLKPLFDNSFYNAQWNFDLEDRDKILRIETPLNLSKLVVEEMKKQGFECEELK